MKTKTTTLHLGLNDKNTKVQEISTIDAYKIVQNLILNTYKLPGSTIYEGFGVYTHENGEIVKESTLIIKLINLENKLMTQIVEDLKRLFNQESIMVEIVKTKTNFR